MNFSVIVPTYKRPDDLGRLLRTIWEQNRLPAEVLLLDDAELPTEEIQSHSRHAESRGLALHYVRKRHDRATEARGSSSSRNLGLDLATHDIVFILDDDLELEPGFFDWIMGVWESMPDQSLAAVAGVMSNARRKTGIERAYNRVFGLGGAETWDVNRAGFQSWDDSVGQLERASYFHGGLASYRRHVARKLRFKVFGGGREALEDVEFCVRLKAVGCYAMVQPAARALHNHSPGGRESQWRAGWKEGRNRRLIFEEHLNSGFVAGIHYAWACFGWVLRQIGIGRWRKALGLIAGSFSAR